MNTLALGNSSLNYSLDLETDILIEGRVGLMSKTREEIYT
jgi:hypothetical protein